MNESTVPALVGRTIAGKFLVESLIGEGSMGAVYKARQVSLEKAVAIKVMHPERACDPMYDALFHREAKAASRLDHPNSVRVVDFGREPDGLLYIAMEYFAGRDLLRVLTDDWPLRGARIADILSQALAAIAVAHDMGMVHRDLKPENILIQQGTDDEGKAHDFVKVCDFGIAKFTEKTDPAFASAGARLTEGVVIGTPHYMSPEQAQGGTLDARTDVYSMGVILYQALTGRVPFEGTTLVDVVVQHVRDAPVPPTRQVPWVDPRLESICLKALKKKKEERYQSAREMRADLRAVTANPSTTDLPEAVSRDAPTLPPFDAQLPEPRLGSTPSNATPPPASVRPRRRRRAGMRAVLFAAMVAIAGASALLMRLSHSKRDGISPAQPGRDQSLVVVPSPSPALAVASDTPGPLSATPPNGAEFEGHPQGAALGPTPPATEPARAKAWPVAPLAARGSGPPAQSGDSAPVAASEALPSEEPAYVAPPPLAIPSSPSPAPVETPATETPAPRITVVPTPVPRPFDPSHARVNWSVAASGGGATAAEVRRALARVSSAWDVCYQNGLRSSGQLVEGPGVLHLRTDDDGRVVQASVVGFPLPSVGPCIAAAAARARVVGVDTGSAWADLKLVFRGEPAE
jgi:eukaryotic-like serine/threonine-protein kinase